MNNILKLISLGFLPPKFSKEELESTLFYLIWDQFRGFCTFAQTITLTPPRFFCSKLKRECSFDDCPIIAEALSRYERKLRLRMT